MTKLLEAGFESNFRVCDKSENRVQELVFANSCFSNE